MSQENVEVVRRLYDAFYEGRADEALDYFAPDVVVDASHRVDGRVGTGPEELVAILAEWMDTWEGWNEEIEAIREAGDQVLVLSTQRGRGKGSGVEWSGRFGMLYELRGGKITRWTIYDDQRAAMDAAGLSD
jgi:ketosteroid isomerase-like protein